MTTSGQVIYEPVGDDLLRRSLRMVGAYAASDNPRPEQINDARDVCNMMFKTWQIEGFLWLKTTATLFLNKGQVSYQLGPSGNHCVTSYLQTTLATDAVAGDTVMTLTGADGMVDGGYIGIANDGGIIEWFTATFSGDAATLSATLGLDAAAGNVVYYHATTAQIERPTRVFLAQRKLYDTVAADGIETEIRLISRQEYAMMPNKTVQGKTVQAFYDPQLVNGVLYVWPTPDTPNDKLVLTVDRPVQILTTDDDTSDFPMEYSELITYGLAERLWWEYPTSGADYQLIFQRYQQLKEAVESYDRENVSTSIEMDWR